MRVVCVLTTLVVGGAIIWTGLPVAVLVHHVLAILVTLGGALLTLALHEYAHGWMAFKLGDATARDAGRLTLNPIASFDPVGLVLVPVTLAFLGLPVFGWAKPVPVRPENFRNPQRDMAWVAAAGPAVNLALAGGFAVLLRSIEADGTRSVLSSAAWLLVSMNVTFGLFNLLPFPPMDGSRILAGFAPRRVFSWISCHEPILSLMTVALLLVLPLIGHELTGISVQPTAIIDHVTDKLSGEPHQGWSKAYDKWLSATPGIPTL